METVLSGIKSSGHLHLGNLFGAVLNWVNIQDKYKCYYMIADLHSLTGSVSEWKNISDYRNNIILNLLTFGIDPNKSSLFIQSCVPAHAQLHLVLSMITPLGMLERNPTYKDQIINLNNKDLENYGFFGYPVLQAADIILYKANKVPVGEDQLPHLEFTREIVRKFNFNFGPVFPEPDPLLTPTAKIPGLDGRKMSKSYNNAIYLDDDSPTITNKVKQLITDPSKARLSDPGHPDICNCYKLWTAFAPKTEIDQLKKDCEAGGLGCVQCKKNLSERINTFMDPYRAKKSELLKHPDTINDIIIEGNKKATEKANETLDEVFKATGLSTNGI